VTRGVRVKVHRGNIKQLVHHPKVQDGAERTANAVASVARDLAPKDQGGGAASIHGERQADGTWRVTWDKQHYYMQFPALGTVYQSPQPFLQGAASRFQ
jgi:hypothetical protein